MAAIIAAAGLLLLVLLPGLANSRDSSPQAVCNNNLKRIGQAYQMWANDHGDQFPFFVPVAEGGLRGAMNPPQAEYQLMVLSNELRHPALLRCPADIIAQAHSFDDLRFSSRHLSYFIAHGRYGLGREPLSGDFNLIGVQVSTYTNCSYFSSARALPPSAAGWDLTIHAFKGHVLMTGGEVEYLSSSGLQRLLSQNSQTNSDLHVLRPRPY